MPKYLGDTTVDVAWLGSTDALTAQVPPTEEKMRNSTRALIVAVVLLNAVLTFWGLFEPSDRDLRLPLWCVFFLLLGAVADRYISKRT